MGDVFISQRHSAFASLPLGAVVATGSLRRRAFVLNRRPDLGLVHIRGNVETRLKKLAEENIDALILAQAGLERLGLGQAATQLLDPEWILPAVGQGALGLECRANDSATLALLAAVNHWPTHQAVLAERALLSSLAGGCQVPIGAVTLVSGETLSLRAAVLDPSGSRRIEGRIEGRLTEAEGLGKQLAQTLYRRGAGELLGNRGAP